MSIHAVAQHSQLLETMENEFSSTSEISISSLSISALLKRVQMEQYLF